MGHVNPLAERTLGDAEAAGRFVDVDQRARCSLIPQQ